MWRFSLRAESPLGGASAGLAPPSLCLAPGERLFHAVWLVQLPRTNLYKLRVDNLAGVFELLSKESGLSVSRNGASFLRIDADAEALARANALLVGNRIKVYELSQAQESLEEAFLRLTSRNELN